MDVCHGILLLQGRIGGCDTLQCRSKGAPTPSVQLESAETLKNKGIALCSLEENLDTSTATGELVFHVFASLAQFERRLIAERTRDGILAAKAKGKTPGRPALQVDKIEAAFALIRAGHSPTEAAKHVGLGRSTVYREIQLRPDVLDMYG